MHGSQSGELTFRSGGGGDEGVNKHHYSNRNLLKSAPTEQVPQIQ